MRRPHLAAKLAVPLFLAHTLSAQAIVVDPTGAGGAHKTITAALAAAKLPTDVIHVRKGTYQESVVLRGRAVSIIGVGTYPTDVSITSLTVDQHPSQWTSRFARLRIGIAQVTNSAGNVVFEDITSTGNWSLRSCSGHLCLTRCALSPSTPGPYQLEIRNVARAFLHRSAVVPTYTNQPGLIPTIYPGTVVMGSNVEISMSSLYGTNHGPGLVGRYAPGGTALHLSQSTCRITGLKTDAIKGGDGKTGTTTGSNGGAGIVASASTMTFSGAQVLSGASWGVTPPPIQRDATSTLTTPAARIPCVETTDGFSIGRIGTIQVHGSPSAPSLTFLSTEIVPFQAPFGYMMLNGNGPVIMFAGPLSTNGFLSHSLDLRLLPATFAGAPYVLQTLTLTGTVLGLSSPEVGAVGAY